MTDPLPPGFPAPSPRPEPVGADEGEGGHNPWLLVGTIAAAKAATIAIVVWVAWSPRLGLFVALTTWYWLIVLAALLAGPIVLAVRLRRMRARREALRRAEWMVEPALPKPVARH